MEGPERRFWQITTIKTIMLGDNWVHFTLCLSTLLRCDILLQLRFWIDAEGFVRYDAFKQKKKSTSWQRISVLFLQIANVSLRRVS